MDFNPEGIERVEEGYRIERDIIITDEFLHNTPSLHEVPNIAVQHQQLGSHRGKPQYYHVC